MLCNVSKLDQDKLDKISALEKELGKTLVAYTCSELDAAKLDDAQLSRLKQVEDELNVSLVAY